MRFLQTDPIPGGSANAYDYCSQDPVNCTDLNGQFGWSSIGHFFKKAAHWVARRSGTLATIASLASIAAWAACPATGFSCGLAVGLDYASTSFAGINAAYHCSGGRKGCGAALLSFGASVVTAGAARFAARGMRNAMEARTAFAYSQARFLERQAVAVGIGSNIFGLGVDRASRFW